ncbi:MAG: Smr/MutS family protein, partial [Deltaproteobacteria bacterium]|nr:Smr/MutS family protein [Deltaproteobacteria bacterium]
RSQLLAVPLLAGEAATRELLVRVAALQALVARGEGLPLEGLRDPCGLLDRAERGGMLEGVELVAVAELCAVTGRLRRFHGARREALEPVADLFDALPDLGSVAAMIHDLCEPDGRVRDAASPELAEMRSRAASLHMGLRDRIDRMTRDQDLGEVLQEPWFTLRDDRYVLPVRAERQSRVGGIVHGVSNTGATVFVEPQALVEMNNRLKLLQEEIARLERALLQEASGRVGKQAPAIRDAVARAITLDGLHARARLAASWDGHVPALRGGGRLRLRAVRHPLLLLEGVEVVPNDLDLEDPARVLVISGPNAGGKSVLLAAVGHCVLLAAAGIPIPASGDSELPALAALYVVLGDLQDLREHLSTFTGHLAELRRVTEEAAAGDLVLIDEIVTGTEPEQGSALAAGFLLELAERGCPVLVTTHYQKLKALALADPRFRSGAVGIDAETHRPTYRFTPGLPGVSSPLEVAAGLGVRAGILRRAREFLSGEEDLLQKGLARLQDQQAALERLTREAATARDEAAAARTKHEALRVRLEKEARQEIARTVAEATAEVREALREVGRIVASLQQGPVRAGLVEERRRRVQEVHRQLEQKAEALASDLAERSRPLGEGEVLAAGAQAFLRTLGRRVEVVDGPDEQGRYRVRFGTMTLRATREELAREWEAAARPAPRRSPREERPAAPGGPAVVDLRGARVDEGLETLARALDDALLDGRPLIQVIHGHGTGAMRKAVREALQASSQVVRHRPGRREEGGDGVTVAYLEEVRDEPPLRDGPLSPL